jgi:transposase
MNNAINPATLKLKLANRYQYEFVSKCLDDLIPEDHKVRVIWDFVSNMDLSISLNDILSSYGSRGRPATDPKIMLVLWIYTIIDGNSSARKLEELCQNHDVYKWICGGITVNRTTLAEFRSLTPWKFDDLLTKCLAVMVKDGLISDCDFAQDGTRIKANAGFNSFHRESGLEALEIQMDNYIKELKKEEAEFPGVYERRKMQSKERYAREKKERVQAALRSLESARSEKTINAKRNHEKVSENDLNEIRASTTDPEVRKMKMGDGGYRLAYNTQFSTGLDSRVIYGVDVVSTLDPGTALRMIAQVQERLKKLDLKEIQSWIADAAYSAKRDIITIASLFPNCLYYAPPKPLKGIDPKKNVKGDCEAIKKWRGLIGTEETTSLYSRRCSTAEFSNMQIKNCGLKEFLVRGLVKVRGMAFLHAIAMNVVRFLDLRKK